MKIYDISQEVIGSSVFPGDPVPEKRMLQRISCGDVCNLTAFEMCAHNGTHLDAPFHFFDGGKTVDEIEMHKTVGYCFVAECSGELTGNDAVSILQRAEKVGNDAAKRILIKGDAVVTLECAEVFAQAGVYLLGNESQTVGPETAPMAVHKVLLGADAVLLEGIRLGKVCDGGYFLFAAPLNIGNADGAPCRAVLVEM